MGQISRDGQRVQASSELQYREVARPDHDGDSSGVEKKKRIERSDLFKGVAKNGVIKRLALRDSLDSDSRSGAQANLSQHKQILIDLGEILPNGKVK